MGIEEIEEKLSQDLAEYCLECGLDLDTLYKYEVNQEAVEQIVTDLLDKMPMDYVEEYENTNNVTLWLSVELDGALNPTVTVEEQS